MHLRLSRTSTRRPSTALDSDPGPRPTTQPGRSLRGGGHGPILLPPLSCLQGLSQAEPTWKPEGKGVTDPMHYWARSQPPRPKAGGGGGEGRHSIGLTEGRQGTRGPCPPVQSPGQGGDMQWETPVLRSLQTVVPWQCSEIRIMPFRLSDKNRWPASPRDKLCARSRGPRCSVRLATHLPDFVSGSVPHSLSRGGPVS